MLPRAQKNSARSSRREDAAWEFKSKTKLECEFYFKKCNIKLIASRICDNINAKELLSIARNIRIKVARAELDMTQKTLAEAVGISRQTMNAIEQGDYNPTIKLCRTICRVLGKSLDDLFGEELCL